jgi:hypothetical protein
VNQHNRGQAIRSGLWNPQFPGEDDWLSFLLSGQELLIGQGGGLKRVQLPRATSMAKAWGKSASIKANPMSSHILRNGKMEGAMVSSTVR